MHHVIGTLFIGMMAGGVTGNGARLRPIARRVVKGGLVAKRKIESIAATTLEETQKLVEEARADLDRTEMGPQN
jgi:molybdenum-dependent DNA-binding transcriptional regulator ModE